MPQPVIPSSTIGGIMKRLIQSPSVWIQTSGLSESSARSGQPHQRIAPDRLNPVLPPDAPLVLERFPLEQRARRKWGQAPPLRFGASPHFLTLARQAGSALAQILHARAGDSSLIS